MMLALLAQTMTATAPPSLGGQVRDLLVEVLGLLVAALGAAALAAVKAWLSQRGIAVAQTAGVDLAEERIRAALAAHPVVGQVLAANGIDAGKLAEHLDSIVKGGIKEVATATGVEAKLNALVHSDVVAEAKKTTTQRAAVDADGNPTTEAKP